MNRVFALALVLTAVPARAQEADSPPPSRRRQGGHRRRDRLVLQARCRRLAITWLHEADVTRTIVDGSSYSSVIGWEKFGPDTVEFIRKYPKATPYQVHVRQFHHPHIRRHGMGGV